jgi:AraC-like DNA-binding protein
VVHTTEIIPGVIFYSYYSSIHREKVWFVEHNTLVLQVSGQLTYETSGQKISTNPGEMLLIHKHQLGQMIKTPSPGGEYQTIVIFLLEDFMRKMALEEKIEIHEKYKGKQNILIPQNEYLDGYFKSVIPYIKSPSEKATGALGMLKVREAVQLLLYSMPELREFLFDFSEPHKIDLEKFMLSNFHFNAPLEKFARLSGRSLAGFKRDFAKTFGMAPRQWLQEKRLTEARHLIETKHKKPTDIYLDLGFESLSHFSHSFKKMFGKAPTASIL